MTDFSTGAAGAASTFSSGSTDVSTNTYTQATTNTLSSAVTVKSTLELSSTKVLNQGIEEKEKLMFVLLKIFIVDSHTFDIILLLLKERGMSFA